MSHTSSIKGVVISDVAVLRKAVEYLASQGVKCSLIADAKPRAYFENQQGMGPADFVLKLDGAKFDVGFYKQPDGTYEPRTDLWGGTVQAVLGAKPSDPSKAAQASLGKLFQAYAVEATVAAARRSGKTVTRKTGANGEQILTVAGY